MHILVLFIANAAIMILEIVGARALAPFMGTSTEVWAGLIGTVLFGLTIGYYLGGRVADVTMRQGHSLRKLAGMLLIAAGIFIILSWTHIDAIAMIGARIMGSFGLTIATAAVALIAFVPASLCLSALSPIIARIKISSLDSAATTIGSLSAVAAAGSIIGSFGAGLIFIPYFGSKETLIGIGVILVITGLIYGIRAKWSRKNMLALIAILIITGTFYVAGDAASKFKSERGIVADIDTKYQRLWVRDTHFDSINRNVRVIQTDPFGTQCAMYNDDIGKERADLVFVYTRAFSEITRLITEGTGKAPKHAIVVGGCNYSFPMNLSMQFPKTNITVVELDPQMEEVAKEWFGFDKPDNMDISTADARIFFNAESASKADLVYYDAFNSFSSIPYQLATVEAFDRVKSHMTEDGILILNVITGLEGPTSDMGGSLYKTLKEVFEEVTFYKMEGVASEQTQNTIAVASGKKISINESETYLEKFDGESLGGQNILTDNFAPIERISKPIRDGVVRK